MSPPKPALRPSAAPPPAPPSLHPSPCERHWPTQTKPRGDTILCPKRSIRKLPSASSSILTLEHNFKHDCAKCRSAGALSVEERFSFRACRHFTDVNHRGIRAEPRSLPLHARCGDHRLLSPTHPAPEGRFVRCDKHGCDRVEALSIRFIAADELDTYAANRCRSADCPLGEHGHGAHVANRHANEIRHGR